MMTDKLSFPVWKRKLGAIAEVLSVLLLGNLIARFAGKFLGLQGSRQQLLAVPEGAAPDYLNMAWITLWEQLLKYGILFGLAFLIGWWHRRRKLKAYGITMGDRKLAAHIKLGIGLFAVVYLLPNLLTFLSQYVSLGPGASHWEVLRGPGAFSFEFWIFMAVSSYLLVPVVEELLIRGYVQTRLTEDFKPGAAIFITAFIFAFAHSQYYNLSVMSIGMLVSITAGSLFIGYIYHLTGSLLPGILAHALANIPMNKNAETVALILIVLTILIFIRAYLKHGKKLLQLMAGIEKKWQLAGILVLIIAGFRIVFLYRILFPIVGALLLTTAIILEIAEKKKI